MGGVNGGQLLLQSDPKYVTDACSGHDDYLSTKLCMLIGSPSLQLAYEPSREEALSEMPQTLAHSWATRLMSRHMAIGRVATMTITLHCRALF